MPDTSGALRGALAGIAATLGMSVPMLVARCLGLIRRQPPEQITSRALVRFESKDAIGSRGQDALAAALHLAFGASAGALYGVAVAKVRPVIPPIAAGVGFALLVWAASYVGWGPALGLMPTLEQDEPSKPPLMIAAHVVYGAVRGALAGPTRRR